MQITLTDFKLMYCLKYVKVFLDKPYFNVIRVLMSFLSLDFFCKTNLGHHLIHIMRKVAFFGKSKAQVN